MTYDTALADRIRARLAHRSDVTEMEMMGGHQFLIGGRICFSVRADTMSVRIDPKERAALLTRPHVVPMTSGRRVPKGFVRITAEGLRADRALDEWITVGLRSASPA